MTDYSYLFCSESIKRRFFRDHLVVAEYQKALIYRSGRYVRTVGAGRYTLWRAFLRESAVVFDMRKASVSIQGQDILTKDHVPIRVTLVGTYQISDPLKAQHQVDSWGQQIYLDLQLALREIVAGLTFDELLDQKAALGDKVHEQTHDRLAEYGVELERAAIKDVTMPASIREMMLKKVEAEKSSEASLVKAREEVAAARARANAARTIAENPAILRLKELETLSELAKSPASTVVFTGSADLNGIVKSVAAKNDGT